MVSTFITSSFPYSDSLLGNQFPSFDSGFTPWDCSEQFPVQIEPESPEPASDPVTPNSGSECPVRFGSSPDRPKRALPDMEPVQTESNRSALGEDERKRRRMKSNRESARRSRMRKQKHLDNLRKEANRFRVENREITNRIWFSSYHLNRVRTDNSRLRTELVMLRQKLNDIRQLLLFQRLQFPAFWPCNSVVSEQTASLMT